MDIDNPLPCPFCAEEVIQVNGAYNIQTCSYVVYWEIIHKKGCHLYECDAPKEIVAISPKSRKEWNTRITLDK